MTEDPAKKSVDQSRRKALKYLGVGVAALAAAGIGGYAWESSQTPSQPASTPQNATLSSMMSTSAAASASNSSGSVGTLHVFEWAGYDAQGLWQPFKNRHPDVNVEFSFFNDTSEMLTKLRNGFQADVIHPCSDDFPQLVDLGLVEPFDMSLLPNWNGMWPKFDTLARNLVPDGNVYFAPADWGYDSVAYRPDLISPENSWRVLWNQSYAQQLSEPDSGIINIPVAGLLTGAKDIWNMTGGEMSQAVEYLIEQKSLIRYYWSGTSDISPLLISGDVVAALTWNDAIAYVAAAGKPIAYMNPKEKRLGYVCGLSIVKGTSNRDLAHDFIDAWLDPSSGSWLINNYYYGHCNQKSLNNLTLDPKIVATMGISDVDVLNETNFFPSGYDVIRYQKAWQQVKAA